MVKIKKNLYCYAKSPSAGRNPCYGVRFLLYTSGSRDHQNPRGIASVLQMQESEKDKDTPLTLQKNNQIATLAPDRACPVATAG